ncbi:MAG TPA: DUF2071 domain-containing protein [Actinomycetota bacterium]|nr:DUF2071 domain-containing protein [Actinomycetota bacterium]
MPTLQATMQRRILVNYRVDPSLLAAWLPHPFRPAVVNGYGVAGICLIRLGHIRPRGIRATLGLTTENAAHRVAVEWDTAEGPVTGVYIPRRDTSSRLAAALGGRAFPGWQHLAAFRVEESPDRYRIQIDSKDGEVHVTVTAHRSDRIMAGSVFADLDAASRFFQEAPVGYAATPTEGVFDGVGLATDTWQFGPLALDELRSSLFDDPRTFPPGSAHPDSAFWMGGMATTWQPRPKLVACQAPFPAGCSEAC